MLKTPVKDIKVLLLLSSASCFLQNLIITLLKQLNGGLQIKHTNNKYTVYF